MAAGKYRRETEADIGSGRDLIHLQSAARPGARLDERKYRVTLAARLVGKPPPKPFGHAGGLARIRTWRWQVDYFRQ